MTQEIVDYIGKCRSQGVPEDLIRSNLKAAGWDEASIEQGFAGLPPMAAGRRELVGINALPRELKVSEPTAALSLPHSRKKIFLLGTVFVVILIAGATGYILYRKSAASPEKLWTEALTNAQNQQSGTIKFVISYRETVPKDQDTSNEVDLSGNWLLHADGTSNFQKSGAGLDSDIQSTIAASLEDFNFAIDIESRNIGNQLFYKVASNPLGSFSEGLSGIPQASVGLWYRQDFGSSSQTQTPIELMKRVLLLLNNADIFAQQESLGTEDVAGQSLAHYQATIDKTKFAKYFENSPLAGYADRFAFERAEFWIGQEDKKIHRITLKTNFPAFITWYLGTEMRSSGNPRDAKRLSDILALMSALEQYKTANHRYPAATGGLPQLEGQLPLAPKPADGSCTAEQNLYWYSEVAGGQSYELKFCLGSNVEGYANGVHVASEKDISPPATADTGQNQTKLADLNYSATLELDLNFSGYNETQDISVPSGAILQQSQGANTLPFDPKNLKIEDITPQNY